MPKFIFQAKLSPTQIIQGEIEAESEQDAVNRLTQSGYFPVAVRPEDITLEKPDFLVFRKINQKDIVLFTSQLSNLIESGVNIVNALNIIVNQMHNRHLKAVLIEVTDKIKDGQALSDSLSSFPQLFSNLYCSMIRTGEASGNLNETLKRLADFLEKDEEFRSSLISSLIYPFFILLVGMLTVAVLFLFVIPRMVTMFEDMGQALPLPTKILINTSSFLQTFWWLILAAISTVIFFLSRQLKTSQGRLYWDKVKLKIFILGPIILKSEISRLMRTLSLLLAGGVPITPSLDIASSVIENQLLKSEVQNFKEQIHNGASLSASLKDSRLFPALVLSIVSIGEETGSLEKSLMRIALSYEEEVNRALKTFLQILEPMIILFMGLIVGFIVLTMLLPIFQINLIVR